VSFITIVFIAVGLAMDAFAVSIATSLKLKNVSRRQVFRLSFHAGLFQFMMPVIGWHLGSAFAGSIAAYDHWIAFALLFIIGGKMIYESFEPDKNDSETVEIKDPTRGLTLLFLVVATSIDALAVGISLAMLNVNIWYPGAVIGVITAALSVIGMKIGERLGERFGNHMELLGGVILVAIGIKIVVEHS